MLRNLRSLYKTIKKAIAPTSDNDEKDKQIAGLINGQNDLRKIIDTLEAEQVRLKTAAVDQGYNVELANQVSKLWIYLKNSRP